MAVAPGGGPVFGGGGELAPGRRQVEQALASGDPGAWLVELGGHPVDGPVFLDERRDAGGLGEEMQLLAVQVLGDRQDARLVIVHRANRCRHLGQAGGPGAAQAALAEDQLVAAVRQGADEEVLQHAELGDVGRQALVLGVRPPRDGPRVPGIGIDRGDREQGAGGGVGGGGGSFPRGWGRIRRRG